MDKLIFIIVNIILININIVLINIINMVKMIIMIMIIIMIILVSLWVIFSRSIRVQTMDFGRQRGFLLDGENPPEKVCGRKESYFLEFMFVDVARDFVDVAFHTLLDGTEGSHNHRNCCCFKPPPGGGTPTKFG